MHRQIPNSIHSLFLLSNRSNKKVLTLATSPIYFRAADWEKKKILISKPNKAFILFRIYNKFFNYLIFFFFTLHFLAIYGQPSLIDAHNGELLTAFFSYSMHGFQIQKKKKFKAICKEFFYILSENLQ